MPYAFLPRFIAIINATHEKLFPFACPCPCHKLQEGFGLISWKIRALATVPCLNIEATRQQEESIKHVSKLYFVVIFCYGLIPENSDGVVTIFAEIFVSNNLQQNVILILEALNV